ncbi:MAG: hypothetical protein MZV63_35860 [Marinilabiliales bacterium]|nr:hypothetical protein [Marinilabiliales bacterium]
MNGTRLMHNTVASLVARHGEVFAVNSRLCTLGFQHSLSDRRRRQRFCLLHDGVEVGVWLSV